MTNTTTRNGFKNEMHLFITNYLSMKDNRAINEMVVEEFNSKYKVTDEEGEKYELKPTRYNEKFGLISPNERDFVMSWNFYDDFINYLDDYRHYGEEGWTEEYYEEYKKEFHKAKEKVGNKFYGISEWLFGETFLNSKVEEVKDDLEKSSFDIVTKGTTHLIN